MFEIWLECEARFAGPPSPREEQEEVEVNGGGGGGALFFRVEGSWKLNHVKEEERDGDRFEWAGQARQMDEEFRVPTRLEMNGNFQAQQNRISELGILVNLTRRDVMEQPDVSCSGVGGGYSSSRSSSSSSNSSSGVVVASKKPRGRKQPLHCLLASSSSSSSSGNSSMSRKNAVVTYDCIGHGYNAIGMFHIYGTLTKTMETGVMKMKLRKYYVVPHPSNTNSNTTSAAVQECVSTPTSLRKRSREDFEKQNVVVGTPPSHPATFITPTPAGVPAMTVEKKEEARLRAQHWRRRQMRKYNSCCNSNIMVLPEPNLTGYTRKGNDLVVSWDMLMVPTGSYTVIKDVVATIVLSNDSEEVVYEDRSVFLNNLSGVTRRCSHLIDSTKIPSGEYMISIEITPYNADKVNSHVKPSNHCQFISIENLPENFVLEGGTHVLMYCLNDRNGKDKSFTHSYAVLSVPVNNFSSRCWNGSTSTNNFFCLNNNNNNNRKCTLEIITEVKNLITEEWERFDTAVREFSKLECNTILDHLPICGEVRFVVAPLVADTFGEQRGDSWISPTLTIEVNKKQHDHEQCVICGDDLEHGGNALQDDLCVAPGCCSHLFHAKCLVTWSKKKRTCPLCCKPFQTILCEPGPYAPNLVHLTVEEAAYQLDSILMNLEPLVHQHSSHHQQHSPGQSMFSPSLWDHDLNTDPFIVDIITRAIFEV